MSRDAAAARATAAGAKVVGSVSGKTDVLVAGEKAGGKVAAARAKGVEVWSEEQFVAALDGGDGGDAVSGAGPAPPDTRAELAALSRKELQARAKVAGLKANAKNATLIEQLAQQARPAGG